MELPDEDTTEEFADELALRAALYRNKTWTDKTETIQTRIQTNVCIGFGDDFTNLNMERINNTIQQKDADTTPNVT